MVLYAVLLYAVPVVVILATLAAGWLGLRFYLAEVVRAPADERDDA